MNISPTIPQTIEQPVEIGTAELRLALLVLARKHATRARHYRKAAQDLRSAISVEIQTVED